MLTEKSRGKGGELCALAKQKKNYRDGWYALSGVLED